MACLMCLSISSTFMGSENRKPQYMANCIMNQNDHEVRGSIAPPQPETPEADAGTDALLKAQEEKNRIITANAR